MKRILLIFIALLSTQSASLAAGPGGMAPDAQTTQSQPTQEQTNTATKTDNDTTAEQKQQVKQPDQKGNEQEKVNADANKATARPNENKTKTTAETPATETKASPGTSDENDADDGGSDVSGGNDKTSCTKLGGTWVDGACKIAKHKPEEIAALKENAAAMRANEQSAANKALGAAGIAGVGLGAMQMASGMAEQNADAAAEEDMRAYLQTFSCRYGNGLSVRGGETNIELPGQPDLLPLYTEYVNLANDIKVRKAALDMQPGIEAESILDSATTGLYDNVGIGKTGGVFASLSRALMDPNGPDAQRWAEQKDEASKKKNTGLQIAGTALVGTAIANMAINANAPKESSDKITAEYADQKEWETLFTAEIAQTFNNVQTAIEQNPQQECSGENVTGGTYPDCTCNNSTAQVFIPEQGECISKCDLYKSDDTNITGGTYPQCRCKNNMTFDSKQNKCIANQTEPHQTETEDECTRLIKDTTSNVTGGKHPNCTCKYNMTFDSEQNKCVKKQTDHNQTATETYEFSTDTFFEPGKSTLTPRAKEELTTLLNNNKTLTEQLKQITVDYCLHIIGHTDRTLFKSGSSMNNQKLSEGRAKTIANLLTDTIQLLKGHTYAKGMADEKCKESIYQQPNDAKCRKVTIKLKLEACPPNTN